MNLITEIKNRLNAKIAITEARQTIKTEKQAMLKFNSFAVKAGSVADKFRSRKNKKGAAKAPGTTPSASQAEPPAESLSTPTPPDAPASAVQSAEASTPTITKPVSPPVAAIKPSAPSPAIEAFRKRQAEIKAAEEAAKAPKIHPLAVKPNFDNLHGTARTAALYQWQADRTAALKNVLKAGIPDLTGMSGYEKSRAIMEHESNRKAHFLKLATQQIEAEEKAARTPPADTGPITSRSIAAALLAEQAERARPKPSQFSANAGDRKKAIAELAEHLLLQSVA